MDLLSVFLIAVGLAMDAFAVSVANGVQMRKITFGNMFKFGLFFGVAQAVMPIIGYFFAKSFLGGIMDFANFIAFAMLSIIGGKMIYESVKHKDTPNKMIDTVSGKTVFLLAIATSIDAMVVGVSFGLLGGDIVMPVLVIGAVSFAFSFSGVFIGKKLGGFFRGGSEIFGGCVLIFIGLKILFGF